VLKKSRVIIVFIAAFVAFWLYYLFTPAITQNDGLVYYLPAGTSKPTFVADLTEQGIITYPSIFSLFIYPQKTTQLKTGEYFFPKGTTLFSLWRQVITGTGLYYRSFTIVPGWTFAQLHEALLSTDTLKHTSKPMDNKQIMQAIGHIETNPEGQFYPETYHYTRGISDLIILKHAYDLMQVRLNEAWNARSPNLPYNNKYEALVAASLIEKEAFLNSERPIIAGVMVNRLHKNMLLQIDPTVIYGLGSRYDGKIHRNELLEDTPYNTYVHLGLPPTPIAMPGAASLDAAVHPQVNDYYYFVAKGDGSHQFSKTLPEHHIAVQSVLKQSDAGNVTTLNKYFYDLDRYSHLSLAGKNHSQFRVHK